MKSKRKQTTNLFKQMREKWALFLFGFIVFYFVFITIKNQAKEYLLNNNSNIVKGVIVDKENYWGNSPVTKTFSYSYEFVIHNKTYRRDSRNKDLKIGDSVLVEYYPDYPKFNRLLKHNK